MDLYVLNKTGVPLRVILIRHDENAPDEFSFVVCAVSDRARDLPGERMFERVLRVPHALEELGGVYPGVTLTFVNRMKVDTRTWVDDDGDGIIEFKELLN